MSARIEIQKDCVNVHEESDESYMEILPSDLSQEDLEALKEWLNKVSRNLNRDRNHEVLIQGEFLSIKAHSNRMFVTLLVGELSQEERVALAAWALQEVQI
jgi:hypothetical protein